MNNYRHEYKYLIDAVQRQLLTCRAAAAMLPDPHAGSDGTYLIRSLYFDDLRNTCLRENEAGTDPRSKFRMRYYNDDPQRIRLEKKSKFRGMTRKDSCPLTPDEAAKLAAGDIPAPNGSMSPVKRRLLLEMQTRGMLPKVIVTYRRAPFVYPAGNVRVTFDTGLTSSDETSRFLTGDYRQRPVLAPGSCVLEVKWDELLPLHIKSLLARDTLQWTAFSKYYQCRVCGLN